MEFQKAYVKNRAPTIYEKEDGRTEQHHKDSVDINNVLEKFQRTGVLEHRNEYRGQYGFVDSITYQEAMLTVVRGKELFNSLPAHIKKRFQTPEGFLAFVQDPNNAKEMVDLGLAESKEDIPSKIIQKDKADLKKVDNPLNKDGGMPKETI